MRRLKYLRGMMVDGCLVGLTGWMDGWMDGWKVGCFLRGQGIRHIAMVDDDGCCCVALCRVRKMSFFLICYLSGMFVCNIICLELVSLHSQMFVCHIICLELVSFLCTADIWPRNKEKPLPSSFLSWQKQVAMGLPLVVTPPSISTQRRRT